MAELNSRPVRTAVDDLGAAVAVPARARRVVSLVPSLTEAVATTVPGVLVGVTDYCTHPPSLEARRVGGSKYPDLARVSELRPELVLANAEENRPQDVQALRQEGIAVWVTTAAGTVPEGLDSVRRMLGGVFGIAAPAWLTEAQQAWAQPAPLWARAIVPVWRRPWVVLGSATFAGDVLYRLGVANVYADAPERYPRPPHSELVRSGAELVVLPDEPYRFTAADGPGYFDGLPCALVSGRHLTWCGPSLLEARELLARRLGETVSG